MVTASTRARRDLEPGVLFRAVLLEEPLRDVAEPRAAPRPTSGAADFTSMQIQLREYQSRLRQAPQMVTSCR